jgi:CRP-like cAMP-binding protein
MAAPVDARDEPPSGPDQRVEILRSLPQFCHAPATVLNEIARLAYELEVDPGHLLTKRGETAHELVIVIEGRATASGRTGVDEIGADAVLGRQGSDGTPEPVTIEATSPMRLLVIAHKLLASVDGWPAEATEADSDRDER